MKLEKLPTSFLIICVLIMVLGKSAALGYVNNDTISTVSQVEHQNGMASGEVENEEKEPGRYITLPGTGIKVFVPEVPNLMNPGDVVEIEKKTDLIAEDDPKALYHGLKAEEKELKRQVEELEKVAEEQEVIITSLHEKLKLKDAEIEDLKLKMKNMDCNAETGAVDQQIDTVMKEKDQIAKTNADLLADLDKCKSTLDLKDEKKEEVNEVWRETLIVDTEEVLDILRENGKLKEVQTTGVDDAIKNWTYAGESWDGISWGKGKVSWSDGYSYDGEWREDMQWGIGVAKWADDSNYTGEFKKDLRWGVGEFAGKNGYTYKGDYVKGKPQGKGKMNSADGASYDGEWFEGLCHGSGTMHFADGRVYQGEWQENQPHGVGLMTFKSGDIYQGEWKQGECWGHGVMEFANGQLYEGQWQANKFWGKGKFIWPDGQTYVGKWMDDKYDGPGKLTLANGTVQEGFYAGGTFIGPNKPADTETQDSSHSPTTNSSGPQRLL